MDYESLKLLVNGCFYQQKGKTISKSSQNKENCQKVQREILTYHLHISIQPFVNVDHPTLSVKIYYMFGFDSALFGEQKGHERAIL